MDNLASISSKITSAEIAQKKWRETSLSERVNFVTRAKELILKHKNEFVKLLISEILKPKKYALDEVERTADMITMFCETAKNLNGEVREADGKMAIIRRQPLGTVLCISPFNYPLNESIAKIVPALLMGNAVLFKPASVGGGVGELIGKCFEETGVPEGVFSLIGIKNYELGIKNKSINFENPNSKFLIPNSVNLLYYLVSHPLIECINFTGSTATAEHISSVCGIKKLIFGLSGKDTSIVLNDADLDLAAREIVSGAFSYSGQRCTGIKRVLVQENIYDIFLKNLEFRILNLETGNLEDEKTNFGPVISEEHANFVKELLVDAENLGAKVEELRIKNYELGIKNWGKQFILPTIVTDVTCDMRIAWEEPFGPILPIIKFKEIDEAVKLCNQSSFGLQNSVFTANINTAFCIADSLECGVVQINGKDARGPDSFPFLGVKKSGLGVVGGVRDLLMEMSTLKSVVINNTN